LPFVAKQAFKGFAGVESNGYGVQPPLLPLEELLCELLDELPPVKPPQLTSLYHHPTFPSLNPLLQSQSLPHSIPLSGLHL
jgi:hypothetical protein